MIGATRPAFGALALALAVAVIAPDAPARASNARPKADAAIARLTAAYPGQVQAAPGGRVRMASGAVLPVDEGRSPKDFDERLDQADLLDQLSIPYPSGCPVGEPALNEDPGRMRSERFFVEMYGGTRKQVAAHIRSVDWFGQRLSVTSVNGVDRALAAVAADLAVAIDRDPTLAKYVSPSAGTFTFRTIAGSKRLSVHAFGAAIDLNTKYSDYWLWSGSGSRPTYRNRIPCSIGEIFEHHGFIWGAKWYHFDSMHFEYRPELLP